MTIGNDRITIDFIAQSVRKTMSKNLIGRNSKDVSVGNKRLNIVYEKIATIIRNARTKIVRAVDTTMVQTYWHIGKYIVEEEQQGKTRANYGDFLITELSIRLTREFGRGFGIATLENARKFYIVYGLEKPYALRREFEPNLSWTHYRALMRENREEVRNFYEKESLKNNWAGRELERQMGSLLYERLAKSKDKKGLMKLANKGQELVTPEDAIKEPVVLEFLNIPESHKLVESKLEDALISNMQNFLLELGRGFAFIARQKRLTLDGDHFYADLVMYHTVLHAYIIIDLKTKPITHADLGQMQLYVNYFDMEVKTENDNPTIGLILCTKQNKKMVRYTLGDKAKQIFASKYQFNLPTEKELETELKKEIKELKHKLPDIEK
jgi:predicted nuclease of restriction endonuclease-like (RecB) superfamily